MHSKEEEEEKEKQSDTHTDAGLPISVNAATNM